ncbi:hypothetical protein [Nonomuraea sp. NPDC050202]|uniref:hypothetical protein n=1 Tax=Nonomuraea sp. NPDC050202 TaxID=3155035 RepID=UPI00340D7B72
MTDAPAIAFGLFCLALGIMLYKKRAKLIKGGGGAAALSAAAAAKAGGAGTTTRARKLGIPAPVLYRIISGLMFFGGVGLASTFIGDWLRTWNFSIGEVSSAAVITIVAVLMFFALLIDVFDGNGLKPTTYGMLVMFPMMWATAGGSLSWPKALSAQAWSWMTGAI